MSTGLRAGTNNDGYLQVNGTDVLTALSSGNIGIGITNPTVPLFVQADSPSAILKIADTTATSGYHFAFGWADNSLYHRLRAAGGLNDGFIIENIDSKVSQYFAYSGDWYLSTNSSTRLTVTSTGNVGIGTNNPWDKLVVYGGGIHVGSAPNSSNSGRIEYNTSNGNLDISAYSTGGNTYARIITSNAGNASEKFRVSSDGKIGIGTTNPTYLLDLNTSSSNIVRITTPSEGGSPLIVAANSNTATPTNQFFVAHNLSDVNIGNARAGALTLHTNNNEKLRITSAGNVGIGTTNPNAKLTVSGDILIGKTASSAGDFISAGGGNSSAYNGLALISNAQTVIAQSNNTLPSWIVDIGGRAADGVTFNVNTADSFSIRRTAAAGSFYGATELFKISNAGIITAPGQICFHAYRKGDGTQLALGTYVYDETLFNRGNCYSTSTGNFTAPVTGAYYFIASLQFYGMSGAGVVSAYFNKNGTQAVPGNTQFVEDSAGGGVHETHYVFSILQLNANDYVNVYRTTTTRNMQSNFCGFLIG